MRLTGQLLRFVLLGGCMLAEAVEAPKEVQPPPDQKLLQHLKGKGEQIYVCQNAGGTYAWKLKAPDAKLFSENGEGAGQHFAGPTWQARDGSRVVGKLAASVRSPDAGSIPWLLLSATSHEGSGVMSKVLTIQRLNTKGGVAPRTGCEAGKENGETRVSYEADYYFYSLSGQK